MLAREKKIRFSNRWTENFLAHTHVDFIKLRYITYIVSIALVLVRWRETFRQNDTPLGEHVI